MPSVIETDISKDTTPTLFYMGHFSYFKGVDLILDTFEILIKEYNDLQLVLANNGLKGDKDLIERVNKLTPFILRVLFLNQIPKGKLH